MPFIVHYKIFSVSLRLYVSGAGLIRGRLLVIVVCQWWCGIWFSQAPPIVLLISISKCYRKARELMPFVVPLSPTWPCGAKFQNKRKIVCSSSIIGLLMVVWYLVLSSTTNSFVDLCYRTSTETDALCCALRNWVVSPIPSFFYNNRLCFDFAVLRSGLGCKSKKNAPMLMMAPLQRPVIS
jgi:hypothetical protein